MSNFRQQGTCIRMCQQAKWGQAQNTFIRFHWFILTFFIYFATYASLQLILLIEFQRLEEGTIRSKSDQLYKTQSDCSRKEDTGRYPYRKILQFNCQTNYNKTKEQILAKYYNFITAFTSFKNVIDRHTYYKINYHDISDRHLQKTLH
mgnify:FL=1